MPSTKPAHKHEFESQRLEKEWSTEARWKGTTRPYKGADVVRLRGSIRQHYTLAFLGAKKLWHLVNTEDYVHALGAVTGNQAAQIFDQMFASDRFTEFLTIPAYERLN